MTELVQKMFPSFRRGHEMKLFQNTSQPNAAAGCTRQFSQHELTGFYSQDGECLLRGTEWIFIYNSGYVFCVDLRTNSDYFPIQH